MSVNVSLQRFLQDVEKYIQEEVARQVKAQLGQDRGARPSGAAQPRPSLTFSKPTTPVRPSIGARPQPAGSGASMGGARVARPAMPPAGGALKAPQPRPQFVAPQAQPTLNAPVEKPMVAAHAQTPTAAPSTPTVSAAAANTRVHWDILNRVMSKRKNTAA